MYIECIPSYINTWNSAHHTAQLKYFYFPKQEKQETMNCLTQDLYLQSLHFLWHL